ncbi:hypothetical protein [[Eubacterium] cellulosolvens]
MLSIAGFGINEIDAEFRYVTLRVVGKSSRFICNIGLPNPRADVLHFRLPQSLRQDLAIAATAISLQIQA